MKKMIKLVAGAVTFGVLSGSVFTGTEYALNRVTGSGITQTQSSKTAATTTKQSDDSTSGITQTSASTSDSKLAELGQQMTMWLILAKLLQWELLHLEIVLQLKR